MNNDVPPEGVNLCLHGDDLAILRGIVGEEFVLTRPEDVIPYSFDGTAALQRPAGCVVLPHSTGQVASILRWAHSSGAPVVTRGSGTGLSGGSVPVPGGIVLCLARMDRVLELDEKNLTIDVEAGVLTQRVADLAAAAGLLAARPGFDEDLHDWWQRSGEFGRVARAEIRRHA